MLRSRTVHALRHQCAGFDSSSRRSTISVTSLTRVRSSRTSGSSSDRRTRRDEADDDHGADSGEERRKDGVALGEDRREEIADGWVVPGEGDDGADGNGGDCTPGSDTL